MSADGPKSTHGEFDSSMMEKLHFPFYNEGGFKNDFVTDS